MTTDPTNEPRTYSDEEIARSIDTSGNVGYQGFDPDWIETLIAIIRQLQRERNVARAEIEIDDKLLADRNRILDALPCPVHGPCVPYVLEFIKKHKEDV